MGNKFTLRLMAQAKLINKGVWSHCGLAIYIKKYLKEKEEL
jgi:hypothetical protein